MAKKIFYMFLIFISSSIFSMENNNKHIELEVVSENDSLLKEYPQKYSSESILTTKNSYLIY